MPLARERERATSSTSSARRCSGERVLGVVRRVEAFPADVLRLAALAHPDPGAAATFGEEDPAGGPERRAHLRDRLVRDGLGRAGLEALNDRQGNAGSLGELCLRPSDEGARGSDLGCFNHEETLAI